MSVPPPDLAPPSAGLRVLHLVPGNFFGGVESLLVTLARRGRGSRDVQQEFALCVEGRLSRELRATGARVHILGAPRLRNPWTVLQARRRLVRILDASSYDVVICHMLWSQIVFGPTVRSRAPLVFFCHEVVDTGLWLARLAARVRPDRALGSSRFVVSKLPEVYPGVPTHVVYPAVEVHTAAVPAAERVRIRRELATPEDAVVVIQVARMNSCKGHVLHIDALAALRDEPTWHCWMVGGPQSPEERPYYDGLAERARCYGIGDRVHFLGDRSDVPRLLSAADVYCQPNIAPEAFGISFIEAMAAGLPVVSTNMGGAREIVDSSCGVLVPPTTSELARALRALIESPERRQRFSPGAVARARHFCDPEQRLRDFVDAVSRAVPPAPALPPRDPRAVRPPEAWR